jgi:hypothetical protein
MTEIQVSKPARRRVESPQATAIVFKKTQERILDEVFHLLWSSLPPVTIQNGPNGIAGRRGALLHQAGPRLFVALDAGFDVNRVGWVHPSAAVAGPPSAVFEPTHIQSRFLPSKPSGAQAKKHPWLRVSCKSTRQEAAATEPGGCRRELPALKRFTQLALTSSCGLDACE